MFQGKSLFQAEMPKETVTQCVSFGVCYCGVSELFNTTNCAGIMKECLFKTNAAPHFASHEVATAYSLGRQPKVAGVPLSVSFFPSFIAAAAEGRKKRRVVQCVEPHANAWGYVLSLLRSWFIATLRVTYPTRLPRPIHPSAASFPRAFQSLPFASNRVLDRSCGLTFLYRS